MTEAQANKLFDNSWMIGTDMRTRATLLGFATTYELREWLAATTPEELQARIDQALFS